MKSRLKCMLTALFLTVFVSNINATLKNASMVNAHARGTAITSEFLGLESIYKNPAGLNGLQSFSILSGFSSDFGSLGERANVGIGTRLTQELVIGLSIPVSQVTDIPETSDVAGEGVQTGTFNELDAQGILTLAYSIQNAFFLGLNATYRHQSIGNESGSGIGFDAGFILPTNLGNIGASIQNIGDTTIEWDNSESTFPQYMNIGYSTPILPIVGVLSVDTSVFEDGDSQSNIGLSTYLGKLVNIKAGLIDIEETQRITAGASVDFTSFLMHYAFDYHPDLGNSHKFGIEFRY